MVQDLVAVHNVKGADLRSQHLLQTRDIAELERSVRSYATFLSKRLCLFKEELPGINTDESCMREARREVGRDRA
jgi:hypothetical protein